MEKIINKLIDIDKHARGIVEEYQDKKNNLDLYVSDEINKRKRNIDSTYNFKIDFRKREYSRRLEAKKNAMQEIKQNGILELQARYQMEKDRIANEIFRSIVKKEFR